MENNTTVKRIISIVLLLTLLFSSTTAYAATASQFVNGGVSTDQESHISKPTPTPTPTPKPTPTPVNSQTCKICEGKGITTSTCPVCNGKKKVGDANSICNVCGGTGKTYSAQAEALMTIGIEQEQKELCFNCLGTGRARNKCSYCSGTGTVTNTCDACGGTGVINSNSTANQKETNSKGTGSSSASILSEFDISEIYEKMSSPDSGVEGIEKIGYYPDIETFAIILNNNPTKIVVYNDFPEDAYEHFISASNPYSFYWKNIVGAYKSTDYIIP